MPKKLDTALEDLNGRYATAETIRPHETTLGFSISRFKKSSTIEISIPTETTS